MNVAISGSASVGRTPFVVVVVVVVVSVRLLFAVLFVVFWVFGEISELHSTCY